MNAVPILAWALAACPEPPTLVLPTVPAPPTTPPPPPPVVRDEGIDQAADIRWTGTGEGDWAGRQVAIGPDLDGDGADDVLIAALWSDATAEDAGATYVVSGGSPDGPLDAASAVLLGQDAHDAAGVSATPAGDVDGDGATDLVIGADGRDVPFVNAGVVYIVHGPVSGTLALGPASGGVGYGEYRGDLAGVSVAGVGDATGDGLDDVMAGARYNDRVAEDAGAAYLVPGPATGEFSLGDTVRLTGEARGDWFGITVAGAGDVDADGQLDVAVAALYQNEGALDAGAVYLFRGPVVTGDAADADAKLLGEGAFDEAGRLGGPGDVDGDGHDDLLVGAARHDGTGVDSGVAYLVRGPVSGKRPLAEADGILLGEAAGDETGFRLSMAGDVNGDGNDDLVVGAWLDDTAGVDSGACYLVYGPVVGTAVLSEADHIWRGAAPLDRLGSSVAGGDLDGDDLSDLVLGASNHDGDAVDGGAAYVVFATSL